MGHVAAHRWNRVRRAGPETFRSTAILRWTFFGDRRSCRRRLDAAWRGGTDTLQRRFADHHCPRHPLPHPLALPAEKRAGNRHRINPGAAHLPVFRSRLRTTASYTPVGRPSSRITRRLVSRFPGVCQCHTASTPRNTQTESGTTGSRTTLVSRTCKRVCSLMKSTFGAVILKITTKITMVSTWINVSAATAENRSPIPATAKSSGVCSEFRW